MKKQTMKNAILLLLTVLLCVSMLCSCKGEDAAPSTPPAQKSTYEQLLGFESYEEITGARIRVGNMLGNIDINTDPKYITQGNGSIRIAVQGDYAEPTRHPFFMLDFMNTTAATFDFSAYKSISFDVYNDSDEDLHIRANINVGKEDGNFIGTAKKTFTIKAKSWTTCTYDFSMMAGFSLYDFTSVRYMTLEFMEHKQSRDDAPHVFYMDNLIGTFFAEGEQPETISYDFHQGIDFETAGTELLFTGQGKKQDASFERVSYDATGIEAPENGGTYALRLSSENEYWPTFRIHFGKELQAGTEISFVAYGRIDGESLYDKSVFEFSSGGDATEEFMCGAWTKHTIILKQAGSYVDLFWNYDRAQITSGKANGEVFIDNIIAKDPIPPIEPEGNLWEGLDFEIPGNAGLFAGLKLEGAEKADAAIERVAYADLDIPALTDGGEYALKLSHENFYWPTFRINFGEKLPKGTIITFQAYARITSGTNNYNKSIFEYRDGLGEATEEFLCDGWTELTMELPVDAEYIDMFWNYDRAQIVSETASAEVYIDNLIATPGKAPIEPVGDFYKGLNFEIIGNVGYFVGQDIKEHDAVIDWVSYDDVPVSAPANGGNYAMRLSHESFFWPTFRMNFGKTLPAGTKITFQAYGTIQGKNRQNVSIFEFSEGGEATVQFSCEKWTELTITLPKAADHIDLFWNYDRAGIVSSASGAVYIDNLIATPPGKPEGDLISGVDFEVKGNTYLFAPIGGENAWRDAIFHRVKYSDLSISAPANGGDYALKLTCINSQWPVFRLNFGTTLKAGTVITFDAYTNDTSGIRNTVSSFDYLAGGDAAPEYPHGSWATRKIILTSQCSYLDLVCNMDRWNEPGPANLEVYLDNFKAVEPIDPEGDFLEGVDFEIAGNTYWFVGHGTNDDAQIDRIAYADANVAAPANGGSYALKLSHENHCWPSFRVNFGKTLKAGTTITFQVYGNYDYVAPEGGYKYVKLELAGASKDFATSEDPNQVVWTLAETWQTATITLTADTDYIDLMYNVADGQHGNVASWLLLDNFLAVESGEPTDPDPSEPTEPEQPAIDITQDIDFEDAGEEALFVGQGNPDSDVAFERVSYAGVNVAAPANGGSYALKLSHTTQCWPSFRVNFGKTLQAGTTITFNVYGNYNSNNSGKYMKLELAGTSKDSVASEDPNQVVWTLVETWQTATITLTADTDHVDFFYNVADGQHGNVASWMLLDNFKAEEPGEPEDPTEPTEPTLDITDIDFEDAGEEALFVGQGNPDSDVAFERVSYAGVNVAAPTNGGSYALKLSHASHCWPSFRVNFGKTFKAGTVITFNVYGNYNSNKSGKYMKLELAGTSKDSVASEDPNQVVWTLVETWQTATITLTADTDHVDFFYNVADGQHGNVASWLLLDNFKAEEPGEPEEPTEPEKPTLDITDIDFEDAGEEVLFVGQGNPDSDVAFERVSYAGVNVAAPANGGSYALKLSHASHCWPAFRVNFGKTFKAGTVITFNVYGNYNSNKSGKYLKLELAGASKDFATSEDPNQVVWTLAETWQTATITLTADTDYIDLMYNVADGQHGNVASWLLLDNFLAVEAGEPTDPDPSEPTEPEQPAIDITQDIDFEDAGEEALFVGQGNPDSDVAFERVSYAGVNVAAPANGGSYALKLSHTTQCWPSFRVNFGKTLQAGTTITFNVYGNYNSNNSGKYMKLELAGTSKDSVASEDPNQVVWTLVETWQTATITLTADTDHVDFFYNVADGQHGNVASWMLLDNFKADEPGEPEEPTEPEKPTLDITDIDFEDAGEEALFVGQGNPGSDVTFERVSYAGVNVAAPTNGGSYALKLSHANHCWPSFRVNFGKTLKAGTVITFNVYGNYNSNKSGKYMKLELAGASKDSVTSEDPNQVVWTLVETWKTATITLTADTDHVDFFYNVADGQHGNVASWMLLDNFKADEPGEPEEPTEPEKPTLDITDIDFEDAGEEALFVGQGNPDSNVAFERVSYAGVNVAAPANGGSYALKLSHASHCWPAFRVNFGKTFKAGTVITFNVYGNYNSNKSGKYMKLELAGTSKDSVTSADPNQVVWTLVETWKTATITLTADTDHVDFFYNVADGQHGNVASWLLLDNFKASQPSAKKQLNMAKEPVLQVQPLAYVAQNIWHKFLVR